MKTVLADPTAKTFECQNCGAIVEAPSLAELPGGQCAGGNSRNPHHAWNYAEHKNPLSVDVHTDFTAALEALKLSQMTAAHRRARSNGADREDAKPIHIPHSRLPNGRNY